MICRFRLFHRSHVCFVQIFVICMISVLLLFTGCGPAIKEKESPATPETALSLIAPSDYPAFVDDLNFSNLEDSLNQSLLY